MCAGVSALVFRTKKCVTLSTTEAEYVALADTIQGAMFLRYVWRFILPAFGERCNTFFEHNEGARQLAQTPAWISNSKHVDARHHVLRELIFKGKFVITQVQSEEQRADFLTQPLHSTGFRYHRDVVMNL